MSSHDHTGAPAALLACFAVLLLIGMAPCRTIAQDDALRYFDQIAYGQNAGGRTDAVKSDLKKLAGSLSLLNEYHRNAKLRDYTLNGGIGFSTFTNVANGDARTNIQVSLSGDFKTGTYPTQHKISGGIQLRNNDGVVFEDISSLHAALDHHPFHNSQGNFGKWLALPVEVYGFIDRSANSYMGVVRRYQGGGGLILNLMLGEQTKREEGKKPKDWVKRTDVLRAVRYDSLHFAERHPYEGIRQEREKQALGDTATFRNHASALSALACSAQRYLRKRYAEHRLSLLMGMLLEDDVVEFTDSLSRLRVTPTSIALPDTTLKVKFINPAQPRVSFRLKYHWKGNQGLGLSAALWGFYWLNPRPWRTARDWEVAQLDRDQREAWRLQIPVEVSYTPDDFVGISLEYSYMKEFSPLRRWVPLGDGATYALFEAPDEFWNLQLKVTVRIK